MATRHLFKILLGLVVIAIICSPVCSQSGDLASLTAQLQKSPTDNALREKVIKLAIAEKPTLPEQAERHIARGGAAFKDAKSVAEYQDAIKEFQAAVDAAPWYGDAYFNLGVTLDKAERYSDALQNLKWAQLASPDAKDIKTLIYEVEYRAEKNTPVAKAAKEAANVNKEWEDFLHRLDGSVFVSEWEQVDVAPVELRGGRERWKVKFQGDQVAVGREAQSKSGSILYPVDALGETFSDFARNNYPNAVPPPIFKVTALSFPLTGFNNYCGTRLGDMNDRTITIDKDSRSVTLRSCGGRDTYVLYKR